MAFFYRDGKLKVGNPQSSDSECGDIQSIAAKHKGPVYVYDLDSVERRLNALAKSLDGQRNSIHYAMKANSHAKILAKIAALGAGADTVSAGEVRRALDAGIPANRIILSGVAKTVSEIEFALSKRIKQINVESPQELQRIADIAKKLGVQADVAFRMNPDVNPKTHPYITTGFRENKFGMDESFIPELVAILKKHPEQLKLRGLTMHIGSQLFEIPVLKEAIEKIIAVHKSLLALGFALDRMDIGGGIGINYETDDETQELAMLADYGAMVRPLVKDLNVELLTEPGRTIVGRSGLLVSEVQYIKRAPAKTFAILDTGMHHLLRPALYGAKHRVLPVVKREGSTSMYDVVGPICESSDCLAKNVELPEVRQGDRLALADSGAYGMAMASTYNSHELPAEVVISKGREV
jgi:diaminopimelate decarboxylase